MSRSFHRVVLGLSVALIAVALLGGFGPAGVSANQSTGAYRQMGVYEEVLHKIQTDYVTKPDLETVTDGALHGLLQSLDPDSGYFTPAQWTSYQEHQKDGNAGPGMIVSKRYGYGSVVSVLPGSPAQEAHIQDGDLINSVEGQSTRDMSVSMIRALLHGQPGTEVKFQLVRPAKPQPVDMKLTRAEVAPPALDVQQYENSSILYLKPYVLTSDRVDQIIARLQQMPKNGNKKVLLDLRDVAEGSPEQGMRLANAFLKSGVIAKLQGQTVPTKVFSADASKFVTAAPLVVLVNQGTAGAAEIVAGAVLDNKRGDVVGNRTFGEGAEDKIFNLPSGAAIELTIAKYETPSGSKIEDNAITPNVPISEAPNDDLLPNAAKQPRADDQLNKGLDILKAKSTPQRG